MVLLNTGRSAGSSNVLTRLSRKADLDEERAGGNGTQGPTQNRRAGRALGAHVAEPPHFTKRGRVSRKARDGMGSVLFLLFLVLKRLKTANAFLFFNPVPHTHSLCPGCFSGAGRTLAKD